MAVVVCPYCFARVRSQQLQFRCLQSPRTRSGQPCAAEPDLKLTAFQGLPAPLELGPVFSPDKPSRRARCPACGVITTKRVCPECHNDLPSGYAGTNPRFIALVGPKTSGKSTYIAVLVRELHERVGEAFGAALSPMDDRTDERTETQRKNLFELGNLPPVTPPSALDITYPQLYRFTVPKRRILPGRRPVSSALAFFDTAGEDLKTEDSTARYVPYLAEADGIILTVDPLQFGAVQDSLGRTAGPVPEAEVAPDRIVSVISQIIRDQRDWPEDRRIPKPLAVTLTKADVLRSLLTPGSPLLAPSHHDGYFDDNDRLEVDHEVRAFLQDWDGGALRRQVEANFASHAFFAISALGSIPEDGAKAPASGIRPFRPEDPVLWLLGRFGLIPVRKAR
jgi:Double-GTPase 2